VQDCWCGAVRCGACTPSICILSDVAGAEALKVQYLRCRGQYRYPIGQPVQQSQDLPTMPLGSMPLLTHAPEAPVPRQPRSLQLTDGVDSYSGPAGLLSILKTGRWKICRYVRRVPRICFQLPRSRLFSCLDNHLYSLAPVRRINSPGSFVILLLLSPQ
jgi:hypothetical protein